MKRRRGQQALFFALLLVVTCLSPVQQGRDAYAAAKPKLSIAAVSLTVGTKKKVTLKHAGKKVKWKVTSGKKHIKLNKNKGKTVTVTGTKKGKAKLTAQYAGKSYTVWVTVKAKSKVFPKKVTVNIGETLTLKLPGKQKATKWKSTNSKILRIKKHTKHSVTIVGVAAGKATLKATVNGKIRKCAVTVKKSKKTEKGYSYSVTPLADSVCSYFYVKTDNPDPKSFVFVDQETPYTESGKCTIRQYNSTFADVDYVDETTKKVNGGYLFYGSGTDGGTWYLANITDEKEQVTDITVTVPTLQSTTDYLINTYTTPNMSFFEKMNAVQKGLDEICLYSGVAVLGERKKSTTSPFYGISTSPHVDQTFYIQDPYYRTGGQGMLISNLYPFRLDSIGFPSQMASVAKKLDASVKCQWNKYAHWLIDITWNGTTKAYGGAGSGGGQGITKDMITHRYNFTGRGADTSTKHSWSEIKAMIKEYGQMTVAEEPTDLPELTWTDVANTVGTEGSYVRLVLLNSIFGGTGTGYTFLYGTGEGGIAYFSNAWYDGRYFNSHEYFEKGTTFGDETASKASIIVKDAKIPFPESTEGKRYLYNYHTIDQASEYDPQTGTWSGFTRYNYHADSNTWIASVYNNATYYDESSRSYKPIEEEAFKDACTLTQEEVAAMNIDCNANIDPTSYYIYDMTVAPGTKGQ